MRQLVVLMRDSHGNVYWLSPKVYPCGRCPVSQREADVFSSDERAREAVGELPSYLTTAHASGRIRLFILPIESARGQNLPPDPQMTVIEPPPGKDSWAA